MQKQALFLLLIIVVGFIAFWMLVLYAVYEPLASESGAEAVSKLIARSFILYAAIMVVTILLLLITFWVEIYVLKPKFNIRNIEAQKWVVKGEVQIEGELRKMREFMTTGNLPAAEASYRRALDIYNWLQEYEISERKKQEYYLRLDKARIELEETKALYSRSAPEGPVGGPKEPAGAPPGPAGKPTEAPGEKPEETTLK